ncbi:UNVERIFIED_CONTAM: yiaN [Trichonephila clavipes]
MAGLVPGLIMGGGLIIAWTLIARGFTEPTPAKASAAERRRVLVDGAAALMLPVIIVGGLRFGIFTPTEAAVVAAVYALAVSTLLYRELDWAGLMETLTRASRTTASVMFLCAAATVSAYMITLAQLPDEIGAMLGPLAEHPRLLMLAIMLLMIAVGMVLDLTPTILILAPVLAPIAIKAGVDPVYFGVIRTTASVMFLCAAATVSAYMITLAQLPDEIGAMLGPLAEHPRLLMLAIMLLMIAVGMVLDLTPTILILAPVLAPIAIKAGVDPVYFGVMFVLIGSIGLITPPVGTVLNVVGGIGKLRMEILVRGVLPFFLIYLGIVALLVAFPAVVTVPLAWLR